MIKGETFKMVRRAKTLPRLFFRSWVLLYHDLIVDDYCKFLEISNAVSQWPALIAMNAPL